MPDLAVSIVEPCVHDRQSGSGESPARSRRGVSVLVERLREQLWAADDRRQHCCLAAGRRHDAIMGA
jgi:hypothetical protein